MFDKLTEFSDYFIKIPAAFLVAIISVLGLILFLPEEHSKILAVDGFRNEYKVFLGPAFLITLSFCAARLFHFLMQGYRQRQTIKNRHAILHNLTPEEKGYLIPYIARKQNTIYVGMDDGIMAGLRAQGITYLAASMGDMHNGFAFNLQPWAREYLDKHPNLLDGYAGVPMTPRQKLHSRWYARD
ncbi:hypothetical protein PEKONANI_00066 [Aeromonas jandaei]|uniref:super-infection exclusion protein B n=1 Tax=Aeromonas jandaei TaxID=650 RepID=UPI0036706E87